MRDEKIGEAMDDVLKASARQALAMPTAACVDAEGLAAWSDGSLPLAEAEAVEVHLAGCARCQAMLATLAVTMPDRRAAVVVPFWQRWPVRWVAPLTAAAAAVLVWVGLPGNRPAEEPAATTIARAEPPPSLPAELPAPATVTEPRSVAGGPSLSQGRANAPAASAGNDFQKTREPQPLARAAQSAASSERRVGSGGNMMMDGVDPTPAAATPAPARDAASLPASSPVAVTSAAPAPASPPPPAPVSVEPTRMVMNERVAVVDTAAVRAQADERSFATTLGISLEIVAAPARLGGAGAGRGGGGGGGRGGTVQVAAAPSASPPTRWRVLPGGSIQRSTSGGTSWEPAGPAAFPGLTAGAAPSNLVCWIVGRTGLVLRTTDGLTFTRLAFPELVDLVTVTAVDAQRATITTANGRSYTTTDGGVSWN